MLALVLFDDGIYYICKKTDITQKGKITSIRYKNRNRYARNVVKYSETEKEPTCLNDELQKHSDRIVLNEKTTNKSLSTYEEHEICLTANSDGSSPSAEQAFTLESGLQIRNTDVEKETDSERCSLAEPKNSAHHNDELGKKESKTTFFNFQNDAIDSKNRAETTSLSNCTVDERNQIDNQKEKKLTSLNDELQQNGHRITQTSPNETTKNRSLPAYEKNEICSTTNSGRCSPSVKQRFTMEFSLQMQNTDVEKEPDTLPKNGAHHNDELGKKESKTTFFNSQNDAIDSKGRAESTSLPDCTVNERNQIDDQKGKKSTSLNYDSQQDGDGIAEMSPNETMKNRSLPAYEKNEICSTANSDRCSVKISTEIVDIEVNKEWDTQPKDAAHHNDELGKKESKIVFFDFQNNAIDAKDRAESTSLFDCTMGERNQTDERERFFQSLELNSTNNAEFSINELATAADDHSGKSPSQSGMSTVVEKNVSIDSHGSASTRRVAEKLTIRAIEPFVKPLVIIRNNAISTTGDAKMTSESEASSATLHDPQTSLIAHPNVKPNTSENSTDPHNNHMHDFILNEDISATLNDNTIWKWSDLNLTVYDTISEIEPSELNAEVPVSSDSIILSDIVPTHQEYLGCDQLDDLSVNISRGECLGVIPTNGCKDDEMALSVSLKNDDDGITNTDAAGSDHERDVSSSGGSSYASDSNDSDDDTDKEMKAPEQSTTSARTLSDSQKSRNVSMNLESSLLINRVGHSAPDDTQMYVKSVEDGNKKDWCVYCDTEQGKLSRHVERKHRDKEDVARLLSYEKGDKRRKIVMEVIRKRGQFRFNTNTAVNTGERKVKRRPNVKYGKQATDFATCPSCYGDYAKTSLRHHYRRCANKNSAQHRTILQSSKQLIGRVHHKANNILRTQVFPTMHDDDVAKAIRYDELVILFGNKLCQKYKDPHFYDMIRQKLRQLGRFLLELRTHDPSIHKLFDVFYPKNYDKTIAAIDSLAGVNESGTGYKTPSLATSLGTLLKQVGKLCVSECIKVQNKEKQTFTEDYLKLFTEDYSTSVARTALETQAQNKRQTKVVLPSTADIQKLQTFLRDNLRKYYKSLNSKYSYVAWLNLAEVSLTSIQLFSRRRAGEIQRLKIEDFRNCQKIDEKTIGDAYTNFTLEEKQAAQKYVRFTIRGKLGRSVPVLLHGELLVCLELLLKYRSQAKVHKNNEYLFGLRGTSGGDYKYIRACNLMRRFAVECGAQEPLTLRGTTLRKHVATMCVNFNLSDGEVSDLANFLGHADKIHKEHYRQPIINREILKISKLLEAVQGNDDSDNDDDSDDNDIEKNTGAEVTSGQCAFDSSTKIGQQSDNSFGQSTSIVHDANNSFGASTSFLNDGSSDPEAFAEPTKKQAKKRSTSPYGKCSRKLWSAKEIEVATKAFRQYFDPSVKLPGFTVIEKVVADNPGVFKRGVATIKTWVSNQRKKGASN